MEDKQKIAAKIAALLSKTVENGATQEEAMMAMQKASELMNKNQLTMTSVELEAEGLSRVEVTFESSHANYFAFSIISSIASLTETRMWRQTDAVNGKLVDKYVIFGLKSDIDFADFLLNNLTRFACKDANDWWVKPENYISGVPAAKRAKLKISFLCGFSLKITKRIRELLPEQQKRDNERSKNGLVALNSAKKSMIEDKLSYMNFKTVSVGKKSIDAVAKGAGWESGDSASLNRAVNSNSTLRIGR